MELYRKTYAQIDLDAIAHNCKSLRANLAGGAKLMACVKADAYGHGAVEVSRAALGAGAEMLAVELAEEGAALRAQGINAPILVMGRSNPAQVELAVENNLDICVVDTDDLAVLREIARRKNTQSYLHIKTDTGMGRIGLRDDNDLINLLDALNAAPGITLRGLYTHFACADEQDKEFTKEQAGKFEAFVEIVHQAGYRPLIHAANSAACIDLPALSYDYARGGISVYGYYASEYVRRDVVALKPAMEVCAEIVQVKDVPAGTPIGYGATYATKQSARIATVAIGYGDGYNRLLSNRGRMIVQTGAGYAYANIVGRVCMDQTMIDVTGLGGVGRGDTVIVMGARGECNVDADEIAKLCGTISYEVLLDYTKRIPRVYVKNGEETD